MRMVKAFTVLFIILIVSALTGLLYSRLPAQATHYEMTDSRIASPVKIVFLSDLHSTETTGSHAQLLGKATDQKPDIIALVGDMIDDTSSEAGAQALARFVADLVKVAPVYYSMGNDELSYIKRHGQSFLASLSAAGATILDETFQDITIKGNRIRLGGLYALAFRTAGTTAAQWTKTSGFLSGFENTDQMKILLCHRPDSFIFSKASQDWNVDLLLSGHTHGGLIRLPLLGGLVAARQGLLPAYDYGQYQLANRMTMIISSGLSGYKRFPRIWNRTEIVVLQLRPGPAGSGGGS